MPRFNWAPDDLNDGEGDWESCDDVGSPAAAVNRRVSNGPRRDSRSCLQSPVTLLAGANLGSHASSYENLDYNSTSEISAAAGLQGMPSTPISLNVDLAGPPSPEITPSMPGRMPSPTATPTVPSPAISVRVVDRLPSPHMQAQRRASAAGGLLNVPASPGSFARSVESMQSPLGARRSVGGRTPPASPGIVARSSDTAPSPQLMRKAAPPAVNAAAVASDIGGSPATAARPSSPCSSMRAAEEKHAGVQHSRFSIVSASSSGNLVTPSACMGQASRVINPQPPTPPSAARGLDGAPATPASASKSVSTTHAWRAPLARAEEAVRSATGQRTNSCAVTEGDAVVGVQKGGQFFFLPPSKIPRPQRATARRPRPGDVAIPIQAASHLASSVGLVSKLQLSARELMNNLEDREEEVRLLRSALLQLADEAASGNAASASTIAAAALSGKCRTSMAAGCEDNDLDVSTPAMSSRCGRRDAFDQEKPARQLRRGSKESAARSSEGRFEQSRTVPAAPQSRDERLRSPEHGHRGRFGAVGTRTSPGLLCSTSAASPVLQPATPPSAHRLGSPPQPFVTPLTAPSTCRASLCDLRESELRAELVRSEARERELRAERRREQAEHAERLHTLQAELARARERETLLVEQVDTLRKDRERIIQRRDAAEVEREKSRMLFEDMCSAVAQAASIDVSAVTPSSMVSSVATPPASTMAVATMATGVHRVHRRTSDPCNRDTCSWSGRTRGHRRGSPSPHGSPRSAFFGGATTPPHESSGTRAGRPPTPPRTPPAPGTPVFSQAAEEAKSLLEEMFSMEPTTPSPASSKARRCCSPRALSSASASTEPPPVQAGTTGVSPSPASSSSSSPPAPPPHQEKPMLHALNGCMPSFPSADLGSPRQRARDDSGGRATRRRSCPVFGEASRHSAAEPRQESKPPPQTQTQSLPWSQSRMEELRNTSEPLQLPTPRFDPSEAFDNEPASKAAPSPAAVDDFFVAAAPRLVGGRGSAGDVGDSSGHVEELRGRLSGIATAVARAMGSPDLWSGTGTPAAGGGDAARSQAGGEGAHGGGGAFAGLQNPCVDEPSLPPQSPAPHTASIAGGLPRSPKNGLRPSRSSVVCRSPPTSRRAQARMDVCRSWSVPCTESGHGNQS